MPMVSPYNWDLIDKYFQFQPSKQHNNEKKKREAITCQGCGAVVRKKKCEYCGRLYNDSSKEKT